MWLQSVTVHLDKKGTLLDDLWLIGHLITEKCENGATCTWNRTWGKGAAFSEEGTAFSEDTCGRALRFCLSEIVWVETTSPALWLWATRTSSTCAAHYYYSLQFWGSSHFSGGSGRRRASWQVDVFYWLELDNWNKKMWIWNFPNFFPLCFVVH